ncbi:DNA-processing protein DprA [Algiphilus sp. W345]|uniref:DNA-processing protein DprA n=1 Tax=Banduia mediterranea TaxID=3075609 RepID=A0ABU2WDR6_9GAMM|nr:DNA-processing protein DprA [Algiphilus sp. W345]MDT0496012.1 DNA-processing protein DprA [Algiphilus sp. W345]
MTPDQQRAWLTLLQAPGVGPAAGLRLLHAHDSAEAALAAGPRAWRAAGIAEAQHAPLKQPDPAQIEASLEWLHGASNRRLLTIDDPDYPARLVEIARAPLALFCQGEASTLARPQLAIVGSRTATAQGLENARAFAAELVRHGLVITSGLALGIDGAAHQGALDGGGSTIAICGTGLDRVYPARHRGLAHRIVEDGCLVSEFAPGTPALPEHFPRRNRILSGLSLGVLVVEAATRSGSLITARLAAEQGREVFAIPGSIHNPMARGCHSLIRQGAKLVETAQDLLDELASQLGERRVVRNTAPSSAAALTAAQRRVLKVIDDAPTAFDTLVDRSGLDVASLSAVLLDLELAGFAASQPGGAFIRLKSG